MQRIKLLKIALGTMALASGISITPGGVHPAWQSHSAIGDATQWHYLNAAATRRSCNFRSRVRSTHRGFVSNQRCFGRRLTTSGNAAGG